MTGERGKEVKVGEGEGRRLKWGGEGRLNWAGERGKSGREKEVKVAWEEGEGG